MPGNPARVRRGPTNPRDTSDARVQKPTGLPPIYEDWTPDIQKLDPRYTRIGPPMYGDRTPEGQGYKTRHPPDENKGLRGIQDFMGNDTRNDSARALRFSFSSP